MEHFRSVTPSTLVICYALVKCIFTAAVLRTYVKIRSEPDARILVILMAVSIAFYFTLICIEIIAKRRLLKNKVCSTLFTSQLSKLTRYRVFLLFLQLMSCHDYYAFGCCRFFFLVVERV